MYTQVNRFLLSHQFLDLRKIPDFFQFFYSFDFECRILAILQSAARVTRAAAHELIQDHSLLTWLLHSLEKRTNVDVARLMEFLSTLRSVLESRAVVGEAFREMRRFMANDSILSSRELLLLLLHEWSLVSKDLQLQEELQALAQRCQNTELLTVLVFLTSIYEGNTWLGAQELDLLLSHWSALVQVRDGAKPQRIFCSPIIPGFYWEFSAKSDQLFLNVAVRGGERANPDLQTGSARPRTFEM
ncbi:nucleolar pre-ribosomal-associated protein 1-like isoform X1 [Catharus ustulatus]|uniref:nucleolar pre-ribosomal-associated protein 1-like isoform X1 n=1 Tax=Catharus ustulatus TaxID=91951 RepID=UPI0014094677|nr:nucleolar pre-ribosomal-associated protein 1-like isoform X1 [Catharus ustulatus]